MYPMKKLLKPHLWPICYANFTLNWFKAVNNEIRLDYE